MKNCKKIIKHSTHVTIMVCGYIFLTVFFSGIPPFDGASQNKATPPVDTPRQGVPSLETIKKKEETVQKMRVVADKNQDTITALQDKVIAKVKPKVVYRYRRAPVKVPEKDTVWWWELPDSMVQPILAQMMPEVLPPPPDTVTRHDTVYLSQPRTWFVKKWFTKKQKKK